MADYTTVDGYKFEAQVNYGWGLTLNMTGKAPEVSKRIFDTYEHMLYYVNDYNDSCVPGLILKVMADTDTSKNGAYFVDAIGTSNEDKTFANDGKVTKLGTAEATSEGISNLQDALDAEIAARKAVDGQTGQTYEANSSAKYVSAATSLTDAINILDNISSYEHNTPTIFLGQEYTSDGTDFSFKITQEEYDLLIDKLDTNNFKVITVLTSLNGGLLMINCRAIISLDDPTKIEIFGDKILYSGIHEFFDLYCNISSDLTASGLFSVLYINQNDGNCISINKKDIRFSSNSLEETFSESNLNKLSYNYTSVTYPSVTSDKTFTPAFSGQTLDEAVFTVESNLSTLVSAVLENEEVTAAAITEIKESVGLDENLKYVVDSNANYISVATTLSEADSLLDSAIANNASAIESLQNSVGEIDTKINNLDSTVTSTDGSFVNFTVVQKDGKLTSVSVAESDIASASALAQEITDRETAITNLIGDAATEYNTLGKLEDKIQAVATSAISVDEADDSIVITNDATTETLKLFKVGDIDCGTF